MQPADLVSYLQQHIAEQKRYDATLSGGQGAADSSQVQSAAEKPASGAETLLVLPSDVKKARKGSKGLYVNKGAFAVSSYMKITACVVYSPAVQYGVM